MEGIYNQENLFAEFKMQKTKAKKVKFLKEMKELKQTQPHLFRGTKITIKNFIILKDLTQKYMLYFFILEF